MSTVKEPWLAPFHRPGYTAYTVASGAAAFAWVVSSLVVSWVTLVVTTDPLAVGAVFAVRFMALLLFGIPAGVLADRTDRRSLIVKCSLASAGVATVLALLSVVEGGTLDFWVLISGSFLLGSVDAVRLAAANTYAVDVVGPRLATSGIAIAQLVALTVGIAGNVTGGYLLRDQGLPIALASMAVAMLLSAVALTVGPRPVTREREPRAGGRADLLHALTLLRRDHLLALLTLTVIVTEVFGFSSMTLVPVFAREVFGGGPDAYGIMSAARSLGGVLGLLVLIAMGVRLTTGRALMGLDALFGASLIAFALAPEFGLALLPLAVAGGAAAACDSLSQSLMQRSIADAERGAAMGVWVFAVGFGPVGHLAAGAAAGRIGPVATQLVFGAILVVLAVILALHPRIRALR